MNIETPKTGVNFLADHFGTIYKKNVPVPIKRFTWRNSNQVQVQVITYGATIISVKCPDKHKCSSEILLGFDTIQGYVNHRECHFGSVLCENVLNKSLNIQMHTSRIVNQVNRCLDTVVWDDDVIEKKVVLSYSSEKSNRFFPVVLIVSISFELNKYNEFIIEYKSVCTHSSITNITHSCYFNLAGHYAGYDGTVKHSVKLIGDIPDFFNSGPKFFREPVYLKEFIDHDEKYDQIYTVSKICNSRICMLVATIAHESSRRIIEIYSNQNGIKIDIGNNFPKSERQNRIKFDDMKNISCEPKSEVLKIVNKFYREVKDVVDMNKDENCKEISELIKHIDDSKKYNLNFVSSDEYFASSTSTSCSKINIELSAIQLLYVKALLDVTREYTNNHEIDYLRSKFKWLMNDNKFSKTSEIIPKQTEPEVKEKFIPGKFGAKYYKYGGVCVKPMRNFDLNHVPSELKVKLKPRSVYKHIVIYKFVTAAV